MNKRKFLKCIGVALAAPSVALAKEDEYPISESYYDMKFVHMIADYYIGRAKDNGSIQGSIPVGKIYAERIKKFYKKYKQPLDVESIVTGTNREWAVSFSEHDSDFYIHIKKVKC